MNKNIIPLPQPETPQSVKIHDKADREAVLENIVLLQSERSRLETEQTRELATLRQKYCDALGEIERFLTLEIGWVEAWARENPAAFHERRCLACAHATIGFHPTSPRIVRIDERIPWAEIVQRLGAESWGRQFLRWPEPQPNKEALLAARTQLSAAQLQTVGLKLEEIDKFYVAPYKKVMHAATDRLWQEAA